VSDLPKSLLVDIGNTKIKYALSAAQDLEHQVMSITQVQELSAALTACDKVVLACVGQDKLKKQLQQLCLHHNKPLQVIETQAQAFGVHCAYEHFSTLGVDRWLAVLAASAVSELPVAILDLGTAATCDFVADKQHLGGWICPGFSLMHDALLANTQKVFGQQRFPDQLLIANSTEECVNMGCLAALQGLLLSAERQLQLLGSDYRIIVSGGAKSLLRELGNERIVFETNMVIKGLARFL
jgi:type III pantothenate kinase